MSELAFSSFFLIPIGKMFRYEFKIALNKFQSPFLRFPPLFLGSGDCFIELLFKGSLSIFLITDKFT
jgi:hypothetical protein